MQYINNTLLKDENIMLITRPHWIVFSASIVIFIISLLLYLRLFGTDHAHLMIHDISIIDWAAAGACLFGVYSLLGALITYYFSEYGITDKRVLMKVGMIRRNSLELFLDKIEAIQVNQSIMARIFNYGTLTVLGTGGSRDPFRYVPQPLKFRKVVQEQIDYFKHGDKSPL